MMLQVLKQRGLVSLRKKYDVLVLCLFFHPDQVTASRLCYEMVQDLVAKGLKVRVLCGFSKNYETEKPVPRVETINGIDVRRMRYIQLPRSSKIGRLINYFSFLFTVIINWPRLINNKCTIVYSDPPILPLVTSINKSIFKIKYIFVGNDIYPDIALATEKIRENSFIHKMMNRVNNRMSKNVDQIVALSHDMKDYILDNRKAIASNQVTVIPNWYDHGGTDVSKVIRDTEIAELRKKYSMIILYSGNMGIAQDIQTIINVAKGLKNNKEIIFIFTGNGQKVEHLKSEIVNHQLDNVMFYDFLVGSKYIDMLKIADVHVISLMDGVEGMAVPSKTYSYMSVGRPIVAIMSDHTDIAKDIRRYNLGCVLQSGEVEKFSEYIIFLLDNKVEVEEIGKRVRNVFNNNYTRKISTTKYYEVIKEIS